MAAMYETDTLIDPHWINHPERGQLPKEMVFGASTHGVPDNDRSYLSAKAANVAYFLGFEVEVRPREVSGRRIEGDYVLYISRSER